MLTLFFKDYLTKEERNNCETQEFENLLLLLLILCFSPCAFFFAPQSTLPQYALGGSRESALTDMMNQLRRKILDNSSQNVIIEADVILLDDED